MQTAVGDALTVVDVTVTPVTDDLADGLGSLRVDVALASASGIPEVLTGGVSGTEPAAVAVPTTGGPAWAASGETLPARIEWPELRRTSGSTTDGVWSGTIEVSPIVSGNWLVTEVVDPADPGRYLDVRAHGATTTLGSGPPPWQVAPAPAAAIRVVTGTETWVPRARVTTRATGAAVGGARWLDFPWWTAPVAAPEPHLPAGSALPRTGADGYVTLPATRVVLADGTQARHAVHVYADRGAAGYSWETATTLWPYVKWGLGQQLGASGRTVTATGKAWPAPVIHPAANRTIHLQRLVGWTWRTVASSRVRDSGRYTITWSAPSAGAWAVRVYKPGGIEGPRTSAGTVGPAVRVVTR